MKKILRSELINSGESYIGFKCHISNNNTRISDLDDVNNMFLFQKYSSHYKEFNTFMSSKLFDLDSDILDTETTWDTLEKAIKFIEESKNIPITFEETCNDGLYENDKNSIIYVLEYEEIKKYKLLFEDLYNQDIYKTNRQKDFLEENLKEKENNKTTTFKI